MKSFIVLVALAFATPAFNRIMNRCSLAREMDDLDVPRDQLDKWTCIANSSSFYNTNYRKKTDYGIFHISEIYWCRNQTGGKSDNLCSVNCEELLTDDITKSVRCAQKILEIQGWSAWFPWAGCNLSLPTIDDCF
ncbi:lysozyme A/C-like [Drosophila ficusphila]|uniref:lysozyme A/C-like n=1 Tax=Drosophila ficusphila TaxID=30025 RepID=UPI0007E89738|nr:lysozyme A/C-like [Drosophila ficusphila]